MLRDLDNIPAIIQRRFSEDEIRAEVYEEVAQFLESVKQCRRVDFLRGIEGNPVDADGWEDMKLTEQHLCKSLAKAIRNGQSKK